MEVNAQYPYVGFKDEHDNPTAALPVQNEAIQLRDKFKNILFAGSYATGKTVTLCLMMLWDAIDYPGNMILTGRKKLKWFKSSTLNVLMSMIPSELLLKWDKQENEIIIRSKDPNKPSKIMYRQLDTSREALDEIQNMEIGLFAPDQIEQLDEEVLDAAAGRLRKKNSARQVFATCNPRGRNWVWKKWIDGQGGKEYGYVESKMWTKGVPAPECQADVTFEHTDNPYLTDDYIRNMLNTYPDKWLDRYVFGSWDDFEGLIYPMWRDDIHLVKPFEIPYWWNRLIDYDFGHRNPTAIGWNGISGDGDLFLYDLHYEAGQWIEYHSNVLKIKSEQNGTDLDDVYGWPADPSIFSKQREVTIAEEWEGHNIYWDRANNDIPGGINRMASYLLPDEKLKSPQYPYGKPKFFAFDIPAMEPFVEEIKNYTWDDLHPAKAEMPEKKNDHSMDRQRYSINWIEDSKETVIAHEPRFLQQRAGLGRSWMSV